MKVTKKNTTSADEIGMFIISAALLTLTSAWILMLLLGMFAGYMAMPGLAIGYWASVGILLMLRLTFKTSVHSS